MELVRIDLDILKESNLNVNEYLTLYTIYLYTKHREGFPYDTYREDKSNLVDKDLLEVYRGKYRLTKEGLSLIEGKKSKFEEFYKIFPSYVTVEDGTKRRLSTQDPLGISAAMTNKLWNRIIAGNPKLQEIIIKSLKIELRERQKQGSLKYMQNINTWLRQASWEKFQHLIENDQENNSTEFVKKL